MASLLERGAIIWVSFTPQKGSEQAGHRPALVISPSAYNAQSRCILVCPITSNITPWPWKVILPDGGEVSGAVLVDQVKSLDVQVRNITPTTQKADDVIMKEVLARLATLTA